MQRFQSAVTQQRHDALSELRNPRAPDHQHIGSRFRRALDSFHDLECAYESRQLERDRDRGLPSVGLPGIRLLGRL